MSNTDNDTLLDNYNNSEENNSEEDDDEMTSEEYAEYIKMINEKTKYIDLNELVVKKEKKQRVRKKKEIKYLNLDEKKKWVSKRMSNKRPKKRKFNPRFPPLKNKPIENKDDNVFSFDNNDFPSL